jgi:hypothetical protein
MPQIQIWAVIVATVASQVVGFMWYSLLFGRTWAVGYRLETDALSSTPPLAYVGTVLGALLFSLAVAVGAGLLEVAGPMAGLFLGVGLWLGVIVPRYLLHALFGRLSLPAILIDTGFDLVAAALTGLIIGAWPA